MQNICGADHGMTAGIAISHSFIGSVRGQEVDAVSTQGG